MRLGVLDIGSNTVHLLVCDVAAGSAPLPAFSVKKSLGLIGHLTEAGSFDDSMVSHLSEIIGELKTRANSNGCQEILAFATSAIRDASNGQVVLDQVIKQTKQYISVLSGEDEARLTFLATRRWFGWSSGVLLGLDIGGGSFEIAIGAGEVPETAISLPLGAGRLTKDFNLSDPPTKKQLSAMNEYIYGHIESVVDQITTESGADHVVGTSKTFRSLARIVGAAPSDDGPFVQRLLPAYKLKDIAERVAGMSVQQRAMLPGVSKDRAAQLAAGAMVAAAIVDLLEISEIEICPWALREGVLLRHIDSLS
ncbi:MAG: Ppx/GppA family phosphatase [Actinomycetota bacterium]|nr:Ppx/GppA family phosphatase [Actinomycetota bacterium]